MYCKKCGSKLDETGYCPICQRYDDENVYASKMSGACIAGFVVSLCGMLIAAIPCGIIGLLISVKGMDDVKKRKCKGDGLAIAGAIVSIVDIILGLIAL